MADEFTTIRVKRADADYLEEIRAHPKEADWEVLARLVDAHRIQYPKTANEVAGETT